MAKKKPAKSKDSSPLPKVKTFLRRHWLICVATVLLLTILGVVGANKLAIANQKRQFDTAEKSLDTLYAEIVKEVGQPTSVQKDKSCGYASVEFGRGRLGCGFDYELKYAVTSADEANYLQKNIISTFGLEHIFRLKYLRERPIEAGKDSLPGENTAGDLLCAKPLTCTFSVSYTDPSDKSNNTVKDLSITLSITVGGLAKSEFYPVKN